MYLYNIKNKDTYRRANVICSYFISLNNLIMSVTLESDEILNQPLNLNFNETELTIPIKTKVIPNRLIGKEHHRIFFIRGIYPNAS